MKRESQIPVYKKKMRVSIPKSLSIGKAWKAIEPLLVQKIGGGEYSPIPNCFDTNAYNIGHIFVQTASQVRCFRTIPALRVLGPIGDFVVRAETDPKWLTDDLGAIKSSGDQADAQIIAEHGRNSIIFTAYDYYFLSKPHDMPIERNVTINRASHEDLSRAKWIGLITGVIVAEVFQLQLTRDKSARTIYIGDRPHTILFKYEICHMDEKGVIEESTTKKMRCDWLPTGEKVQDNLPLTEFVSESITVGSTKQSSCCS